MEFLTDPQIWIAFLTLTVLEIVLGIDNIVFISILAGKLPAEQQGRARNLGLTLALLARLALLFSLSWLIGLTTPLFEVLGQGISGRDMILLAGGLFLVGKSTYEMHENLEGPEGHKSERVAATLPSVLLQIFLLDVVFSLDSVITAIGMADEVAVMAAAIVVAIGVMMLSAEAIHEFIQRHPTFKMLALAFLLLIGVTLVAEGLGQHVPKGYLYFAMAFAAFVEVLNLRMRKVARQPIHFRRRYREKAAEPNGGGEA
jgi:predicted tellurium resistance membrane protein TerC